MQGHYLHQVIYKLLLGARRALYRNSLIPRSMDFTAIQRYYEVASVENAEKVAYSLYCIINLSNRGEMKLIKTHAPMYNTATAFEIGMYRNKFAMTDINSKIQVLCLCDRC